jgi:hypothetical protein
MLSEPVWFDLQKLIFMLTFRMIFSSGLCYGWFILCGELSAHLIPLIGTKTTEILMR